MDKLMSGLTNKSEDYKKGFNDGEDINYERVRKMTLLNEDLREKRDKQSQDIKTLKSALEKATTYFLEDHEMCIEIRQALEEVK